jgi:hypothetical protein
VPTLTKTTPEPFVLKHLDVAWPKLQKLAKSMNRELFYDGAGRLVLRKRPGSVSHTFGDKHLTSFVQGDRTPDKDFDTFEVLGRNPKGPTRQVRAWVDVPNGRERNGKRLRIVDTYENDQIKNKKDALEIARRRRSDALSVIEDYQGDMVPWPLCDENDLIKIGGEQGPLKVRLRQWTLPLAGGDMTFGTIRRHRL